MNYTDTMKRGNPPRHIKENIHDKETTLFIASKHCMEVVSIILFFKTLTYLGGKWVKHTHSPGLCVSVCDVLSWSHGVGLLSRVHVTHPSFWWEFLVIYS